MGRPKQLLRFGETTLLGRVVENFTKSKVDEVIAVVASASQAEGLEGAGPKFVLNQEGPKGLSTSLRAGLREVHPESEAVLFGLADKPFVRVSTINKLIDSFRESGRGIVIPVYRGTRGNPILFGREFFPELSKLSGDVGGKAVIRNHEDRVLEVSVDDVGTLIDIDTQEDYERAKIRLAQSRKRSPR